MSKFFYVNSQGLQVGPVDKECLVKMQISRSTLVWKEGTPGWIPAELEPELNDYFNPAPKPQPQPNCNSWSQQSQSATNTPPNYAHQGYAPSASAPAQPQYTSPTYPSNPAPTPISATTPNAPYTPADTSFSAKPPSYMWLAICTTLLCFLPFGIVSIVYASKVDSNWASGNYARAIECSEKAKTFGITSASIALVFSLAIFLAAVSS
ncbi:MAG: CD225/dispanin family protein [Bacteroidales bacterium]|nr:CD225/dispanin family protein [Bacteroidales bacterium]